jgi:GNAT superfamily N-acetyltransferase
MLTRAYVASRPDFPDDPAVLGAYGEHDPTGAPSSWVVLWDGDVPLSALRLFIRTVWAHGEEVSIGGIGNVGTDPAAAGRGLASRVMREAHRQLVERDITTAVLVTDIAPFYARLGYEPVKQRELLAAREPGVRGARVPRRLTRDVPEDVQAIHASAAREIGGRVLRDDEYWSRWVMDFHVAKGNLDALVLPGAYLIGRSEETGGAYRVLEGGGDPVALRELVTSAARAATRLKVPDEPIFRRILYALASDVSARARTGIMARALVEGAIGAESLGAYLELDTF